MGKFDEYEIEWWGEWLNANPLKRSEVVKKLPMVKNYRGDKFDRKPVC